MSKKLALILIPVVLIAMVLIKFVFFNGPETSSSDSKSAATSEESSKEDKEDKKIIIAKIDGQNFSKFDLRTYLDQLPPQYRQMPLEAIFPQLQEQFVMHKALLISAQKANIEKDKEAQEVIQAAKNQIIQDFYLKRKTEEKVTDEKVKEAYDSWTKQTPPMEELRAQHILVATEAEGKKIISEIKANGQAFEDMARKYSLDKNSSVQGGDIGPFTKNDMIPEIYQAATKMQKGEISQKPIKTQYGFHIIKLTDKRQRPLPTLEEATPLIKNTLMRELVGDVINEEREAHKIELFDIEGKAIETPEQDSSAESATPIKEQK